MSESEAVCERCGAPALVHVTNEIGQEGSMRHLCLSCADRAEAGARLHDRGLNHGAILVVVGLFTLLLSIMADWIGLGGSAGFGWKQYAALALGVVLLGAGALVRASTILLIGGLLVAITLLADWIRLGGDPGFGLKQMSGSALGTLMIAAGIARVRWGGVAAAR